MCVARRHDVKDLGQSEVSNAWDEPRAIAWSDAARDLVQQHVARLQIAVQDPAPVGMIDGLGQGGDEFGGDAERDVNSPLPQPGCERHTGTVRRDDVALGSSLAGFVHWHDIRMIQSGGGQGLVAKSCREALE